MRQTGVQTAELKTQKSPASVSSILNAIPDDSRHDSGTGMPARLHLEVE